MKTNILLKTTALLLALIARSASAAIVTTEDFSTDIGVTDRDGIINATYDGGNDWMTGSFSLQMFPVPQQDAFVITDPDFTGDYSGNGVTQFSFQMFAVNVVPSDLFIRIVDGANVFSYQFNPIIGMLNNWQTFTVDLAYSFGWSGGESAFNTALTSVDSIEIQITRSGTAAQEYRLDNLQTFDTPLNNGGGGGPSAVPEPNTISFVALVVMFGLAWRRRSARAAYA